MPDHHTHGVSAGLIDMHSHLLPGIDDGCESIDESVACIQMLQAYGFVGTICTPHLWPRAYPDNTPAFVEQQVAELRNALAARGVEYQLWVGGELRLDEHAVDWMEEAGVPTLAGSRCVLMDTWDRLHPPCVGQTVAWLMERGYQPILAHPERTACTFNDPQGFQKLLDQGVWLQCNALSMTGAEGEQAARFIRQLLRRERCQFMALDMHGLGSLPDRLLGVDQLAREFGDGSRESLLRDRIREHLAVGLD